MVHHDEAIQWAGDAIAGDGDVRPVDPVDAEGTGRPAGRNRGGPGVFVLYDYHCRDADAIAARHGVSVLLPAGMTAPTDEDIAASAERFEGQLDDTGYYLRPVTDTRLWQRRSTARLAVAESVGAADYFFNPRRTARRIACAPARAADGGARRHRPGANPLWPQRGRPCRRRGRTPAGTVGGAPDGPADVP